jgi:hypothetical protein
MSRQFRVESDDLSPTLDRAPCDARALAARHGIHIDAAGREHTATPRENLARALRNMHRADAREHNRRDDETAHLSPRERLAAEVREMWRGAACPPS